MPETNLISDFFLLAASLRFLISSRLFFSLSETAIYSAKSKYELDDDVDKDSVIVGDVTDDQYYDDFFGEDE